MSSVIWSFRQEVHSTVNYQDTSIGGLKEDDVIMIAPSFALCYIFALQCDSKSPFNNETNTCTQHKNPKTPCVIPCGAYPWLSDQKYWNNLYSVAHMK